MMQPYEGTAHKTLQMGQRDANPKFQQAATQCQAVNTRVSAIQECKAKTKDCKRRPELLHRFLSGLHLCSAVVLALAVLAKDHPCEQSASLLSPN